MTDAREDAIEALAQFAMNALADFLKEVRNG